MLKAYGRVVKFEYKFKGFMVGLGRQFSLCASSLILSADFSFADAPTGHASFMSGASGQMLMLLAFFLIFYFMIIRPQNKRAKAHRELLANLSKGDEVTTNGGILGKVTKVGEHFLMLMVSDGVEIRVHKQSIANVMPKGTYQAV